MSYKDKKITAELTVEEWFMISYAIQQYAFSTEGKNDENFEQFNGILGLKGNLNYAVDEGCWEKFNESFKDILCRD